MKITRRTLLGSAAGVAAAAAQTTPPAPAAPVDYAGVSAAANQRALDAIAKVSLPQSTEPAFSFKA